MQDLDPTERILLESNSDYYHLPCINLAISVENKLVQEKQMMKRQENQSCYKVGSHVNRSGINYSTDQTEELGRFKNFRETETTGLGG